MTLKELVEKRSDKNSIKAIISNLPDNLDLLGRPECTRDEAIETKHLLLEKLKTMV